MSKKKKSSKGSKPTLKNSKPLNNAKWFQDEHADFRRQLGNLQRQLTEQKQLAVAHEKRLSKLEATSMKQVVAELKGIRNAIKNQGGLTSEQERENFAGLKEHVEDLKGMAKEDSMAKKKSQKKFDNKLNKSVGTEVDNMQPTAQEYKDLLAEADVETNRISARIEDLTASIKPGMTDEEAVEVKDGLKSLAEKLKGVGTVPVV